MKQVWMVAALAAAATAQDTRKVTEPVIPPTCTVLTAALKTDRAGHSGMTLAEGDETKLDTGRIQAAVDGCAKGHAVELAAGKAGENAFLSGPLGLREGVTLVIDKGVTLFGSRDPKVYEVGAGTCGIVNNERDGCRPLISVQHARSVGIMGEGTIDGRGGKKLLGQSVSWWDLAEQARNTGRQQVPRILVTDYADDLTLYKITLKNSPNFHVVYNHGDGFTVWGIKLDTPQRLARNTDGIDPGNGSKNISILYSWIRTGDDNIAIKGSGKDGVTNMTVAHNHFYWGHGMSIGSETYGGVSKLRVTDLSLDGPDSGIRIKSNASRGGLVTDVVYDDVCIRNSPKPLDLDTNYGDDTGAGGSKKDGDRLPVMRDVTLHNVRVAGGGKISLAGYDHEHRIGVTLDNVLLDGGAYKYVVRHADITLGPGPVNLLFTGAEDSTKRGEAGKGSAESCAAKFVAWPKE